MVRSLKIFFVLVLTAIALAVSTPSALAQTTASPTIEVFTYGTISDADRMKYLRALEGAILFTSREFGQMPLTIVRLRLYENEEWFARGLMEFAGLREDQAATFARLFSGTAIEGDSAIMIKINPARPLASSQYLVTNELVHLLQSSWARSVNQIAVWLAQGQSVLYSARHAEHIVGPHAAGHYRRGALAAVRERWTDLTAFSITQTNPFNWMNVVERFGRTRGWHVIYAYSFLAYEYLVEKTSVQAVLNYFARLKDGMPEEEAFLAAFGFSASDFDTKVRAHIGTLVRQ